MRKILAAGAMALAMTVGHAEATVYRLTDIVYQSGFGHLDLVGVELNVSDAAVASGSFKLSGSGVMGYTGDLADFVSFFDGSPELTQARILNPFSYNLGSYNFDIQFSPNGDISSGNIDFLGYSEEIDIAGQNGVFAGTFGSDMPICPYVPGTGNLCSITSSRFTQVPEPMTLALLAGPVIGVAVRRRAQAV